MKPTLTPLPIDDYTCRTCGGGFAEHVLCGCGREEEDHYECVEEILRRMADDGDETGQAAIALIDRLKSLAERPRQPGTCNHDKKEDGHCREMSCHNYVNKHRSKFDPGEDEPQFVIEGDPPIAAPSQPEAHIKLTAQQLRVINTPDVWMIGWDQNNRPVVVGKTGIPKQVRQWALKRNGDPADIKGKVRKQFDRLDDRKYDGVDEGHVL